MGKKIIVAGGGHGGIAAAMRLAQYGFDVTVYEKNSRENMGYDWTDIFDRKGFTGLGIPMPDKSLYKLKHDMTFYGPAMDTPLTQNVPEDQLEIQMERKDIYNHLISHAEKAGVKFVYNCEVTGPVLIGNRVVGIKTADGEKIGDLVIDACGIHSPVRMNLPSSLGIQKSPKEYELFYVYRAFYNKTCEVPEVDKYKVLLLPEGGEGISWVATEEEHTDVLIGRFHPFTLDEALATVDRMRKTNPSIGEEKVRGGQFVKIPVRQPLGIMVADGYAAIGDSAFMTVPVIGSGIANSLKAAKILADTVIHDVSGSYSAETLWKYQTTFYKQLGNGLAPLACVKMMLARFTGDDLDHVFRYGILNADDMTIGADSTNLSSMLKMGSAAAVFAKLYGLTQNKQVALKVGKMIYDLSRAVVITLAMPKTYNRKAILKWANEYNKPFRF